SRASVFSSSRAATEESAPLRDSQYALEDSALETRMLLRKPRRLHHALCLHEVPALVCDHDPVCVQHAVRRDARHRRVYDYIAQVQLIRHPHMPDNLLLMRLKFGDNVACYRTARWRDVPSSLELGLCLRAHRLDNHPGEEPRQERQT